MEPLPALLSLVIPGAGQLYRGQPRLGVLWLVLVIAGYFLLVIPGVILHLLCIGHAALRPLPSTRSSVGVTLSE